MEPKHKNKGLYLGGFTDAHNDTDAVDAPKNAEAPKRQRAEKPPAKTAVPPTTENKDDDCGCGGGK